MGLIHAGEVLMPCDEGEPLPPEDAKPAVQSPSLEQVYRVERTRLLRFLARRSGTEDHDDIVQQSFVRLLSMPLDRLAKIRRLDSYLFRVAHHLGIDHAKASQRRSSTERVPLEELELEAPEQIATPDQIAGLEARDMLNRLEAVIQRMKPRTREIFLAHRIDGYSYGEIAARTGLSVKGVEKHMTRAIATIDRSMRQQ